jgi:AMMECR1 domain-containing protein
VFVSNLLHGFGLVLLKDEQKFNLRGCVGTHKTSILYTNISSISIK